MIKTSVDELLEVVEDRYSLVIAASKRARQILESETDETTYSDGKPLSIASKEIVEGRVKCIKPELGD